ncbi:MAG: 2-amino-5-chloromuconate deaminase CnbZ [Hyphomicrobiaceae bacterium]
MSEIVEFGPGGYRYIPSVFQYSGGVAALPGYRIVRETLRTPLTVEAGFQFIAGRLRDQGLALQNFCACELRSPGQFTDDGFRAFNKTYIVTLREWGIMNDDIANPVARSNVCPMEHAPQEPSFYAFSYARPAEASHPPTAVISGSAEAREPQSETELYRDRIVRFGETTPDALRDKVQSVLAEMERRLGLLGFSWADTTSVQAYSLRDFHHMMGEIANRQVANRGLTWHFARPPVVDLEYEMDCRVVYDEATVA